MDEKFMKVLREQQEIQQKAARILHDTEKMKEEVQNKLESLKRKVENDFKNIGEFLKEANVQFATYEYIFQEDDCKRIQINEQKYQTFDVVVEKTEEKSNEDSTFAAESDNADESAETTPNDDTSDREIQCAACGNISKQRNWFLSRIGTHYVICPKCGTLRYVCHNNAGYRKE